MTFPTQPNELFELENNSKKLFNFEESFDIASFDKLTNLFYHGQGAQNELAKRVLEEFLKDARSWCRVDTILEYSQSDESRFYALLILEKLVTSRWKLLPNEQRTGIRNYMVSQIVTIGSLPNVFETRKIYLNKLICLLVEICKYEWPRRWPDFISEIVESSKLNETLCLINMKILRLLSEEIFVFSSSQMNHIKANYLKATLTNQFPSLFDHIFLILNESTNAALIIETLKAFSGFINWIPPQYIFETTIINILMNRLLKEPSFSNDTISCLAEIMDLPITEIYQKTKCIIYCDVLEQIKSILPYSFNFNIVYNKGNEIQQIFLSKLAIFFTQSLNSYSKLFDTDNTIPLLKDGLEYLLSLSNIEEIEIFKICIDFWKKFTENMYIESISPPHKLSTMPIMYLPHITNIFTRLRRVIITHMKRPEEVIIYVNDLGEVVRQFMRDTDSINIYQSCRDALSHLTVLKPEEVKDIILEKLEDQMNGRDYSWNNLNSLGWAVGSISGSMDVDMERDFLVTVLKNLLTLCEIKSGKDNKAIIASNIMYVVQQYPRFLKPYYKFLKTVVNKLFEFMHETHEGVQDMACDAFLKIAKSCKFKLSEVQTEESQSYIENVIPNLPSTISLLSIQQKETVYEGIGTIISAIDNTNKAKVLITSCLQDLLSEWNGFISEAKNNPNIWNDVNRIQNASNFFKIATALCKSVGEIFEVVLSKIFMDLLNAYSFLSQIISHKIATCGLEASSYSEIKVMRTFKRDVLILIGCWIGNVQNSTSLVHEYYFPSIVQHVFTDYSSSVPPAREAEVLTLATTIISNLRALMNDHILTIFQHLFDSTLSMINQDLQEYPEHRIRFFKLIEVITNFCFSSLIRLSPMEFDFIMQSLFYGMSQTMPDVASTGLNTLITIFKNIPDLPFEDSSVSTTFYKTYYCAILDRILHLATDGLHASDLTDHAFILSHMYGLVNSGKIASPLYDNNQFYPNNEAFVKDHSVIFLKQQHEHLTAQQLLIFINGLFCFVGNQQQFIQHLKDFLIQLKEHQGEDSEDLFMEEVQKEMSDVVAHRTSELNQALSGNDSRMLQDYHTVS